MLGRSYSEWWGPGATAQRKCGCPISGGIQGQVGWALGSLSWWVATSPWQGVGAGWAFRSLATQTVLWFSDSMIAAAKFSCGSSWDFSLSSPGNSFDLRSATFNPTQDDFQQPALDDFHCRSVPITPITFTASDLNQFPSHLIWGLWLIM